MRTLPVIWKTLSLAAALSVVGTNLALAQSSLAGGSRAAHAISAVFVMSDVAQKSALGASSSYSYPIGSSFGAELETLSSLTHGLRAADLISGQYATSSQLVLNGFYEINRGQRMKTYFGAGFGMMDANEKLLGNRDADWVTSYQVHSGISVGLSKKLIGGLEYRWAMGSMPHLSVAGIPAKLEVKRHGVVVGLNYHF